MSEGEAGVPMNDLPITPAMIEAGAQALLNLDECKLGADRSGDGYALYFFDHWSGEEIKVVGGFKTTAQAADAEHAILARAAIEAAWRACGFKVEEQNAPPEEIWNSLHTRVRLKPSTAIQSRLVGPWVRVSGERPMSDLPTAGEVWCGHGSASDLRVLILSARKGRRVRLRRLTGSQVGKEVLVSLAQLQIAFRPCGGEIKEPR